MALRTFERPALCNNISGLLTFRQEVCFVIVVILNKH